MKPHTTLTGILCLGALLTVGCSEKSSKVEDSPSASTTIRQTEEAARKGDAFEMMNLGMTYYQGNEDVNQDFHTAYIWLTLAAENEELKNAADLQQALADLNQQLTDTDKGNARVQINKIREGFPGQ